jgi:CRISPR/Cas system-associated endonuclease Cas3-HD
MVINEDKVEETKRISTKDEMIREIELILQSANSKIWSTKIEALNKISEFIVKLQATHLFTYNYFEKLFMLVIQSMTDIHFKVSA